MNWLKNLFTPKPAHPPAFDAETATAEQIIAESQRLAAAQEAIKSQRRELAAALDKKLNGA